MSGVPAIETKTSQSERMAMIENGITPRRIERELANHSYDSAALRMGIKVGFLRHLAQDWNITARMAWHTHRQNGV